MRSMVSLVLVGISLASTSSAAIPPLSTYIELAASIVPLQFQSCLTQLNLDSNIVPDGVKPLRSNLLHARDLIDIFSFAFPPVPCHASTCTSRPQDLLLSIRNDLDEGYTLLGDFQDLAHRCVCSL